MVRFRRMYGLMVLWLVAFAGSPMVRAASSDNTDQLSDAQMQSRIDYLILRLGEQSYHAREAARWELQRIGLAAFDKLMLAKLSLNPEIAASARYLLNSQRVIWSMQGDSLQVRQLLQDYNQLSTTERESRMALLADLHAKDAFAALVRLARFEVDERLSKVAALFLMEQLFDTEHDLSEASVVPIIRDGIAGRLRTSTSWLRQFADFVEDKKDDAQPWREFLHVERRLFDDASDSTSAKTAGRLYDWTAQWLAHTDRRDAAIAISVPRLSLLAGDEASLLEYARWALDSGLPELVEKIAEAHGQKFDTKPLYRYMLAESMLKRGDADRASEIARQASELVRDTPRRIQHGGKADDNVAYARGELSERLLERGLFQWAEMELKKALELDLSPAVELPKRLALCDFYWDAGSNQAAAEVLAIVVKKSREDPSYAYQLTRIANFNEINLLQEATGNWHFYAGLAAIDRGDFEDARAELSQAYAIIRNNPDILIAMVRAQGDAAFQQQINQRIDDMVSEYRAEVRQDESKLATATPLEKRTLEANLASSCNQLSWLLACTQRNPSEAISLSKRSLILSPNSSTYLDTLGRCYFEAGHVDKAIEAQGKAARLEPYRRQIQRQLAEFKQAAPQSPDDARSRKEN